MNKIITIGREFGSGGRELGRRLSEELNIPYYDQEIVAAVASRTKLSRDYVQRIRDHRPMMSFPIHIGRSFYHAVPVVMQQTNSIFLEESKFLKEMAEQSDCVIVGRCADVVLREYQPLRIFVYADMESKLGRCLAKAPEHEKMTPGELKKHILTIDRNRAQYYEYFTGRTWGDRVNYDLCVNTTNASVKELAHVLAKLY